jgi:hypothetical protein
MANVVDMLHDKAYLVQNLKESIITLLLRGHGSVIAVENNQHCSNTT